ncbi:hypothetical protein ACFY7C_18280 [Streptomyces sp. NPDC012769]|uniref:hypothetical protein n=1 Tax=Streptomyces sp. NPDC012769 TaxID=3364848 RepID=UPI00369A59B0
MALEATFFTDNQFSGKQVSLKPGRYRLDSDTNDQISSVKVPVGLLGLDILAWPGYGAIGPYVDEE